MGAQGIAEKEGPRGAEPDLGFPRLPIAADWRHSRAIFDRIPARASLPLSAPAIRAPPHAARADGAAVKHLGGAATVDQARRLHGAVERRQQDAQARIPDRRGARQGRGHDHHPGRDAVEPRAPDRGGRGALRPRMPHAARGSHRLPVARLHAERQCASGPAARRIAVQAAGRDGHECGDGKARRRASRQGQEALCHSRRRIQCGGCARLRQLRAGIGRAGQ